MGLHCGGHFIILNRIEVALLERKKTKMIYLKQLIERQSTATQVDYLETVHLQ